jgi:hypothetical protein
LHKIPLHITHILRYANGSNSTMRIEPMSDLKTLLAIDYATDDLCAQEILARHNRIWQQDREEISRIIKAYSDRPHIMLSALDALVSSARREGFSDD